MKALSRAALWIFAPVVLAGCASAEITQHKPYRGETLARPERIIVPDFTGNPADVPSRSPFAAQLAATIPPTPEQREVGRKLGAQIARELIADLQAMGCPPCRLRANRRRRSTTSCCGAISSRSTRAVPASECSSGSAAAQPR